MNGNKKSSSSRRTNWLDIFARVTHDTDTCNILAVMGEHALWAKSKGKTLIFVNEACNNLKAVADVMGFQRCPTFDIMRTVGENHIWEGYFWNCLLIMKKDYLAHYITWSQNNIIVIIWNETYLITVLVSSLNRLHLQSFLYMLNQN